MSLQSDGCLVGCECVPDGVSLPPPLLPRFRCAALGGGHGGRVTLWFIRQTEAGIGIPGRSHSVLATCAHSVLVL